MATAADFRQLLGGIQNNVNSGALVLGPDGRPMLPGAPAPQAPPIGLTGAEQAIRGGANIATGFIEQGITGARQDIGTATQQAIDPLSGFAQAGQGASDVQAALSGALGPEAQAQAFQNFQASPGQQFLQEQGEQARLRNASALGGLGGGNIQRELTRFGQGLAATDFQNQFANLGGIAGRGAQAATGISGIQERGGQNLANLSLQGGLLPANIVTSGAGDIANKRFTTGRDIAQAISGTGAGVAGLQADLGGGLSNVFGQGATNLANVVSGAGSSSANLQQNLGTILANIGVGAGSSAADFASLAGQFDAAGTLGSSAAGSAVLRDLTNIVGQNFGTGGGVEINQQLANQSGIITPAG